MRHPKSKDAPRPKMWALVTGGCRGPQTQDARVSCDQRDIPSALSEARALPDRRRRALRGARTPPRDLSSSGVKVPVSPSCHQRAARGHQIRSQSARKRCHAHCRRPRRRSRSRAASRLTATAGSKGLSPRSSRARPAATRAVSTEQETEQSTARAPTGERKVRLAGAHSRPRGRRANRPVRLPERLKFEVEYGMQRGSTDNSYIVKGADKTALLDLPDKSFVRLRGRHRLRRRRLHRPRTPLPETRRRPRHRPEARPADAPAVEVWCSNPAAQVISPRSSLGHPLSEALTKAWKRTRGLRARLRTVKTGEELPLGGARRLQFTAAPTPVAGYVATLDLERASLPPPSSLRARRDQDDGADETHGRRARVRRVWRRLEVPSDCMLAPMARPAALALTRSPPTSATIHAERRERAAQVRRPGSHAPCSSSPSRSPGTRCTCPSRRR